MREDTMKHTGDADVGHSAMLSNFEALQKTARGFVDQGVVPGVALAWQKDDGPIQYHAYGHLGFGSPVAVNERSLFRIFSMTKPITGIAAMMLVEAGSLSLDQPLSDILPAFRDMEVVVDGDGMRTRRASGPITIRHLLTHTAGFGSAGMTLGGLYVKNGIAPGVRERVPGPGELATPKTLAELGARVAGLPLAADPGTRFDYSISLDILGLVIETVSGMPFDRFLQQRLFEPLGMIDTGFAVDASRIDRFADLPEQKGLLWTLADDPRHSRYSMPYFPSGGGGLVSTAQDYARFAAMILNDGVWAGQPLLKPEIIHIARSNLLPEGIDRVDLPLGQTLAGIGFGAGMSVQLSPGRRTEGMFAWPGEVPVGVVGWPGAAGTACWIDPDRRFFLVLMTQYWPSWLNASMRPDIIAAAYSDMAKEKVR
ncbi:putative hydrolase [Caenibius tardaugens NBRC 16725]|uniref:Putative hydrolase n=3 Tax=Caenibius TaxID=2827482 RepID=U2YID2_9SPHN|nr:putative hydrolase [Caenibius tardaugens NBRC 16725]